MSIARFAPLLLLAALPTAVSAQSMNAEAFYKKAAVVQSKGAMAIFSSDTKLVMKEAKAAAGKARETRLAAVKAGLKPRYCPPQGSKGIGADEYMKGVAAIPAAERTRIDMTEATTRILARKFPCPA